MKMSNIQQWWPLGTVRHVRPLVGGAINTSFRVSSSRGEYVLRLYQHKSAREIGFELALLSRIKRLPVPKVVRARSRAIMRVGSLPAIIYSYIPGKTLARHTKLQRKQVGQFLAAFHNQAKGMQYREKRNALYDFPQQKVRLFTRAVRAARVPYLKRFLEVRKDIRRYQPNQKFPRGPIHADVKPDNVLFQNGTLSGVIDFDNAYIGPCILDLAKSMAWFGLKGSKFSMEQAADVYCGYVSRRTLSTLEYRELYAMLRYAFASHLFVDFYMRAIDGISKKYFSFLMKYFYPAYQSLTKDPQEFYALL